MAKPHIDIILPVYYEQDSIKTLVTGIEKKVKTPHQLLFVFQDRNDPSVDIVHTLKKNDKAIQILYTKNKIGLVHAIKEGLLHTKSEIIVIMMSDLSDDPETVDRMVEKIGEGYDIVCASRYMMRGKRVGGPKLKGLLSYISCTTLHIFTGINTHDATNAFKCFRMDLIKKISIESTKGYEFPLELIVKANAMGMKIGEVSTVWQERKKGKSKFKLFFDIPYYLRWYLYAFSHGRS